MHDQKGERHMKQVVEGKIGKKSLFTVNTIIDGEVVDTVDVNVQVCLTKIREKDYYLLYDSNHNLIPDAYDFLNHSLKQRSVNSKKMELYALRYLYVFSEIIQKPIQKFNRNDFLRLNYFLTGVSSDGSEYEYNLLTKRGVASVNCFFSVYREFYRHLGLESSPILRERSFSKYVPNNNKNKKLKHVEVPKYISTEQFKKIITYIRTNITDEERRLRDECIIRIMYEGGCRIGEVLGSTLEDYVLKDVNGQEMCFLYIRNRFTDKNYQNAKTCMNIYSRKSYNSYVYETNKVGYQLTFLNVDTYDLICEYIDIAHDKAYKKYRKNYDQHRADSVGEYKAKNEPNYYLFLNNRGEPLSDEGWNKELRFIFQEVGLHVDTDTKRNNLNHRFRHGFIMHLIYDLKMPREKVMARSRHTNYSSLDAYYNPTTEQIIQMKTEIEDVILNKEEADE